MDLKLALQEGTHALYCEPSQECMSKEVLNLRGELGTATLLNAHSVKLLSALLKALPQLPLIFGTEQEASFQAPPLGDALVRTPPPRKPSKQ